MRTTTRPAWQFNEFKPVGRDYGSQAEVDVYDSSHAGFIERQARAGGDFLREDAEGHFRDENSTYDWVIDGLFARSGLKVTHRQFEAGVIGTYVATKG